MSRTGLGGGTIGQQCSVAPHVIIIVIPVVGDAKGIETAGVVVLINHLGVEHLRVAGVDLQDAALRTVGSPDDDTVAFVVGQAYADLRCPRLAILSAQLPRRLVVVVLHPAVVLRRNNGQDSVGQLELQRPSGVDPAILQGVAIKNLRGTVI